MLLSNQLHDFTNNETSGFIMRKKLKNTSNSDDTDLREELFINDINLKHHLTTEKRLAVIKTRIVSKHSVHKI